MRIILALALLALGLPAHAQIATENRGGWNANQQLQQNGATHSPSARANAQTASSATAGGSSSGVSVGGDRVIVAPGLPSMASGPCTGAGGGVSVGVVGFSGGAGYTSIDPGCDARETARVAHMLGLHAEAQAIMRREVARVLRGSAPAALPTYNTGAGQ